MIVVKSSNPSVPKATARMSCVLDWHIGLPEGLLVCWPPVQMEGRASQCQLVSRIKTTHLFAEVSHNATGPKHVVGWGLGVGKGSCSGEVEVALVRASRGPPGLWPLPRPTTLFPALLSAVTYHFKAARSHYRSVRKAAGRVASPQVPGWQIAGLALAEAEEWKSGKAIGCYTCYGQEVGTESWWGKETEEGNESMGG